MGICKLEENLPPPLAPPRSWKSSPPRLRPPALTARLLSIAAAAAAADVVGPGLSVSEDRILRPFSNSAKENTSRGLRCDVGFSSAHYFASLALPAGGFLRSRSLCAVCRRTDRTQTPHFNGIMEATTFVIQWPQRCDYNWVGGVVSRRSRPIRKQTLPRTRVEGGLREGLFGSSRKLLSLPVGLSRRHQLNCFPTVGAALFNHNATATEQIEHEYSTIASCT